MQAELNAPQQVVTCQTDSISAQGISLPQCIPMTTGEFGLVSSIFTLGGLSGALIAGPLASRYGRFRTMLGTTVFNILGPVLEALAPNLATMTAGRLISGLGAGAALVVVPVYISEIAPPQEKGFFGAFTQIGTNFGIFTTELLGLFLSKGQFWRVISAAAGVLGAAQVVGLVLGGQESPKWMADNGHPSQAKRILQKVRGHKANIEQEVKGWGLESTQDLEDEQESLLNNEDHMSSGHPNEANDTDGVRDRAQKAAESASKELLGPLAVIRHPDSRDAVIAVTVIMVGQQLCGINSIVMYGVGLLSDLLEANSALLNVAVAVLNIIVTTGCAPLPDKIGRKPCLLLSIAGMGISSLLLGIGISKHITILSAVSVLTFVASFGLGLGPIPFILSSELVGAEAVGSTQSWALAANWIATFVVAQFFPIVNEKLGGGKVYFIFAVFALVFGAFTLWWIPETKGKSNADEVWGRKKSASVTD